MAKNSLSLVSADTVTFGSTDKPYGSVASPDSKNLYVVLNGANLLMQYAVDQTTGALSTIPGKAASLITQSVPRWVTISPDGKHVYVIAAGAAQINVFARDATDGSLIEVTPRPSNATLSTPNGIVVSPDGAHVYVPNSGSGTISLFTRDSTTGKLTPFASPTVAIATGAQGIGISPDGTGVYVPCNTVLYSFTRDTSTGALTASATPTYTASTNGGGNCVAFTPDSLRVYVSCGASTSKLACYSRNASTNALTALAAPTRTDGGAEVYPWDIEVSADGTVLYVAQGASTKVDVYDIASDGTLALRQVVNTNATAGSNATYSITALPNTKFAYAGDYGTGSVSAFAIEQAAADVTSPTMTGGVSTSNITTTTATISWSAGSDNVAVTGYKYSLDNGSTYTDAGNVLSKNLTGLTASTTYLLKVYAYDAAGNISSAITGSLTTAATSDTTAPTFAGGAVITQGTVTNSSIAFSYPAATDNVAVTYYEISKDNGTTWVNNGTSLSGVFTGLTANTLYNIKARASDAANNKSTALALAVTTASAPAAPVGGLTLQSTASVGVTGSQLYGLAVSPDSKNVYAVINAVSPGLAQFAVDQTTGALSVISGKPARVTTSSTPRFVAVAPDGKHVYVVVSGASKISIFSRDATDGSLTLVTELSDVNNISVPNGIGISPDSLNVYVTMNATGKVVQYSRDTTTGLLTLLSTPSVLTTATNPNLFGVKVTPDGTGVYVASGGTNAIYCYNRDAGTGLLTPASTPTIATTSSFPDAIAISDDSQYIYVACDSGAQFTSCFKRNTTTNVLTDLGHPAQTSDNNGGPWSIALSKDVGNTSLYLALSDVQKITQYDRSTTNLTNGGLTFKTPGSVATSNNSGTPQGSKGPYGIVVAPNNKWLFSTDSGTDVVATYAIAQASGGGGGIPAPTGTITSQPAPDGQNQRFVGTTTDATSGVASLTSTSGGSTFGPVAFTVSANAFDFTLTGIPAGNYTPNLTVTGPGGGPIGVSGTSAISILGMGGTSEIPASSQTISAPPVMSGVIAISGQTTDGFTFSYNAGSDDVGVVGYEYSLDNGATWLGNATALSKTMFGLNSDTTYPVSVRCFDADAQRSNILSGTATTLRVNTITFPSEPRNPIATAVLDKATISFDPPLDNGGAAILFYTVTASSGQTASGPSSPITLTVPNGNNITFTVTATNSQGTGPASVPSNPVIPGQVLINSVTITPATATIDGLGTVQFEATIDQTGIGGLGTVTWTTDLGTILPSGLFTAPLGSSIVQLCTITATSDDDNTIRATAVVAVNIAVVVIPPPEPTPVRLRSYNATVRNSTGAVVEGADVTVFDQATGLPITLWKDADKTIERHNPLRTDESGYFEFFVDAAQCGYTVKGFAIKPYTRNNIFDVASNIDLTPINEQLTVLSEDKASIAQLAEVAAQKASVADLNQLAQDVQEQLDTFHPVITVNQYVTGGDGTQANPWTGWDTAVEWLPFTQYDFEDGYYAYIESPNFAKNFLRLNGKQGTIFVHTGTQYALLCDAGGSTEFVTGVEISVHLKGNTGSDGGVYMRACCYSKFDITFVDIPAVCFMEYSGVLNKYNLKRSDLLGAQSIRPVSLLQSNRRLGSLQSSANEYALIAERTTGTAIVLNDCVNSRFIGGTVGLSSAGIFASTTSDGNTFTNMELTANDLEDIICQGDFNTFQGVRSSNIANFAGTGNIVQGGLFDQMVNSGSYNTFGPLAYGTNRGEFRDYGKGTVKRSVINIDTGNLDEDLYPAIRDLKVNGKTSLGKDTLNVGDGQIFKNPDGKVMIGTTILVNDAQLQITNPTNSATAEGLRITMGNAAFATSAKLATMTTAGSDVFIVLGNGNTQNFNNSYGAISDIRYKENIVSATPKLDKLMQVNVVNYNLIGHDETLLGVISQELEEIFPNMIDTVPVIENGEQIGDYKAVKYSVFVPMLIKAIQELKLQLDAK